MELLSFRRSIATNGWAVTDSVLDSVTIAALRAQQLMMGCVPRVEGDHKATTIAQMEVSQGRVTRSDVVRPEAT